ncbi:hypothetical protein [Actinacidiphila sp. ITFR-21]|uniref:hypothetical protein n=1 Tax=Actinacidiphila sp. ITFR-21 TaxID=3075199 RepID=UPI00288A1408|nr:hypothetical protein [Streptomyces sp. ITFR-21]WNI19942.1 hypothetical protein RLT57_30845 [Streptomyces sp. ITFR-21]
MCPTSAAPLTLTIRVDVRYTVTDRWLLLASAQALAMSRGIPLPVDAPGAIRTLLMLTDPVELQRCPEDVGLTVVEGGLTATYYPAHADPGRGTAVLELAPQVQAQRN